ncbi:MAG: sulfite exporter TauE/SafE family protein [Thermoleophilaceae bacterium]
MGLAAIAALVGAFIQSATGFGFALVLSPALFAVLEPEEAVGTMLVLGLALNLLVLVEGGWHADWRRMAPMLVAALPGLVVGVVLLSALSKEALQVIVGLAVIAAGAWQLLARRAASGERRRTELPAAAGWAVGFLSGTLTTSISVSGPPIVLWLEARGVRPAEFRATLAASFLALNLAGWVVLVAAEGSGSLDAGVAAPLLGLVLSGHVLGALAFRRLDPERFFGIALALVLCTGAASLVAGLV